MDGDLVVIFTGVVAIVLVSSYFSYLNRVNKRLLIEKLLEKGQAVSPELLDSLGSEKKRTDYTISGSVFMMLLGVALAIFFWGLTGGFGPWPGDGGIPSWLPVIGIFPFIVGLSRLIGLIFEPKRRDR